MGQLSENIFGKDIKALTLNDIADFFLIERTETSILEFKTGDVSLEKVYSEVSAFLNTDGGILIIGAPKKSPDKEMETYIGSLIPTTTIKTEQSLLHSIASNVVPSPVGIEIKSLKCEKGLVFILEIPQSKYPPHQNDKDGKYYIRLDTETKRAPHGLIQALFFQRQYPNLEVELFSFTDDKDDSKYIEIVISNSSLVAAENIGLLVDIYGILYLTDTPEKKVQKGNVQYVSEDRVTETEDRYHFIFRANFGDLVKGLQIPTKLQIGVLNTNYLISIGIWAKNQELKIYTYVINPESFKSVYKNLNNKKENIAELVKKHNVKIQPNMGFAKKGK